MARNVFLYFLKRVRTYLIYQRHCQNYALKNGNVYSCDKNFYFHYDGDPWKKIIISNFRLLDNFISPNEEEELMIDVEPKLKRQKYQFDHWDDAIHGFRETETVSWKNENKMVLERLRSVAFLDSQLPHTHILDLAEDGHIKPHIDSIRYCGDTIAGISLLSDSVMRLVHSNKPEQKVDIFLPRRSLYIMAGPTRYDYTHEILHNKESIFNEKPVRKMRRVSIICRSSPKTVKEN